MSLFSTFIYFIHLLRYIESIDVNVLIVYFNYFASDRLTNISVEYFINKRGGKNILFSLCSKQTLIKFLSLISIFLVFKIYIISTIGNSIKSQFFSFFRVVFLWFFFFFLANFTSLLHWSLRFVVHSLYFSTRSFLPNLLYCITIFISYCKASWNSPHGSRPVVSVYFCSPLYLYPSTTGRDMPGRSTL